MKKQLLFLICAMVLGSCTTPTDVAKEQVIQFANVEVEHEKTEQLRLQWKIDSLKHVNNCKPL